MSEYVIVTDSALDMNAELVGALGVDVLPLTYTIEGKDYKNWPDHREMPLKDFYQAMRDGAVATTSALNAYEYIEKLTPILDSGKDVLVMVFDAALSMTTLQSAQMAAEELREKFPERKIMVEDTRCVTGGLYLLLTHACAMWRQGASMEAVRDWCEGHKYQVCHCFTVEDLKYLRRGGRISATTAVVGGMLNIKPVLHVDHEGNLINIGKVRGRSAALSAIVDRMAESITEPAGQTVVLCHADCLEDARKVAADIEKRVGVKEVVIGDLGPVIGAHTGPGLLAAFFFGTERG